MKLRKRSGAQPTRLMQISSLTIQKFGLLRGIFVPCDGRTQSGHYVVCTKYARKNCWPAEMDMMRLRDCMQQAVKDVILREVLTHG